MGISNTIKVASAGGLPLIKSGPTKPSWTLACSPLNSRGFSKQDLFLLSLLQRGVALTEEELILGINYEVYGNCDPDVSPSIVIFVKERLSFLKKNGYIKLKDSEYSISESAKGDDNLTSSQTNILDALKKSSKPCSIDDLIPVVFQDAPVISSVGRYSAVLNDLWILRARGLVTSEELHGSGGMYSAINKLKSAS